jgi:small subunit ribosomal protein S20
LANIKSAIKRIRSSSRKRARNKPVRTALKTYVKSAQIEITSGSDTSAESVVRAISALDKAANKGIIHKNQAARRKARLVARLNQMAAAR